MTTEASLKIVVDASQAAQAEKTLASLNQTSGKTETVTESLSRTVTKLAGAYLSFNTVQAGFRALLNTVTETERLRGSLETMTGSTNAAADAFDNLTEFAAKTPFTLDQSVNAFIKLKALGLDPSERALTSYGNTAAAMGKSMTQMIEAVADASTMQFERLKEFGIKAAQEGENVTFTFRGVATTVKKDAAEIEEYLMRIGETQFGDAMANQMERLPGKISNLEDAMAGLWRTIGDSGATDALIAGVDASITVIEGLTRIIQGNTDSAEAQAAAFDKVRASLGRLTQDELVAASLELQRQMNATYDDIRAKERLLTTLHPLSDAHKSVTEQVRLLNDQLNTQRSNHETLVNQLRRVQEGWNPVTEAVIGATAATETYTRATRLAGDETVTLNSAAWKAAAAYDGMATASGRASVSMVADVKDIDAVLNTIPAGIKRVETANADAAKASADDWRMFRDSVSDSIADIIMDADNAGEAIVDSFKRTFAKILAEFALSGIAGMFTGKGMGGFNIGTAISGAGASGKILSGIGSIFGGGSAATAAVTPEMAAILNLPAPAAGAATGGIGATIAGGLKSVAAGASNLISAIPGWGWALGAAALAVNALDKSTPSHNAGMLLHDVPGAKADQKFSVPAFASGFQPIGFARRENQQAANDVINVFRADDAVLTELAKQAGISVNLNASTFRPIGLDESGKGDGVFVGSAREEGGGSGKSLDAQRDEYVAAYIRGISNQIGPMATAEILAAGGADAMINRAAELVAKRDGSHADGLDYVPFDGYRATLHQGERVQTARQARNDDSAMMRLTAAMERMQSDLGMIAMATKRTADILRNVTRDGNSLLTEAV